MGAIKVYAAMAALIVVTTSLSKVSCSNFSTSDPIPLYFGLMLSLSGDHQSSGALAGVQAALDEINSRDDLLPGYSLNFTLTESQVYITV